MGASFGTEQRVDLSLAIQRYLRAVERFHAATQELNGACENIRQTLPTPSRFVTEVSHQHYLVTSDEAGNFDIEELDAL